MKQTEEKIIELKEHLDDLYRVREYLAELETKIVQERNHLQSLEKIADKEYQDIAALEKKTFVDFFIDYSEEREKKKEKEKEEYLTAVMDCRNLARAIKGLEFEAKVLREKLATIPKLEKELHNLKNLRKGKLIKTVPVKDKPSEAIKTSDNATEKFNSLFESADQVHLRLSEINTCLDRIAIWGSMGHQYQENRRRHMLRDVANLEAALVWLQSDAIQMETKIAVLHQQGHLGDVIRENVLSGFQSSFDRLKQGINNFMTGVIKNTFTAVNIGRKCQQLKGYAKSMAYQLKQLKHHLG